MAWPDWQPPATCPNSSLTITVHEEPSGSCTDRVRLPLTKFGPEKAAKAQLGAGPDAMCAAGRNRDDAQGQLRATAHSLRDQFKMENITLADAGAQLSIWALFLQAGWVVKLVMIGLLGASIWTWAIIFDKLVVLWPHAAGAQPVRADLLVGAIAGRTLPHAGRPQDLRHGRDLRRRHARVEEVLREGRQVAARAADPHRQGDGPGADARDGAARRQARLPRHDRLGRRRSSACSARWSAS